MRTGGWGSGGSAEGKRANRRMCRMGAHIRARRHATAVKFLPLAATLRWSDEENSEKCMPPRGVLDTIGLSTSHINRLSQGACVSVARVAVYESKAKYNVDVDAL